MDTSEYDETTYVCFGCGCEIVDISRQTRLRVISSPQEAVNILFNYASSMPSADDDVVGAAFYAGRLQGLVDAGEGHETLISMILEANDFILADTTVEVEAQ